jgi:hypothetical protein
MTLQKAATLTNLPEVFSGLQAKVEALQETLLQIAQQNNDTALDPAIAKGASECAALRDELYRLAAARSVPDPVIDARVLQRLIALAGPVTTIELLDQIMADLSAAHAGIVAAAPVQDWKGLRSQCHIVIAVAGSIGAEPVQIMAEHLHHAAVTAEAETTSALAPKLLARLESLMHFVQSERLGRVKT